MQLNKKNNNSNLKKSTTELKKVMDQVLSLARAQGASDAAVSVNHDYGFSVDVRMGTVETVSFGEDRGVAVTVYFGHRKGSASSTDVADSALSAMVEAACEIARVSAEDPCFGLADKELMTRDFPDLDLYHPWDISTKEAIDLALACENKALAFDKRIVNSDGVSVSTFNSHLGYANTLGGEGMIHGSRHGLSCSLIAKEGDEMQRDYDYTTSRLVSELTSAELLAESAAEKAVKRLGARQIKTERQPVVFSPRVSSGLFGSFISAISGSNLYRKNSFLVDSLHQQVFPDFLRIYEQPHLLAALGSAAFDGEGVPTRNNVFVEAGRVESYALGTYSARRMGLKTTANASGVHNLTIDANAKDLKDILKAMGRGLLVTELMGQGVNLITGNYSRGASGFWVEQGEIQFPVENITVASNLAEMFKNIVLIGADRNPNNSTRCGSVLISEMMVAGE